MKTRSVKYPKGVCDLISTASTPSRISKRLTKPLRTISRRLDVVVSIPSASFIVPSKRALVASTGNKVVGRRIEDKTQGGRRVNLPDHATGASEKRRCPIDRNALGSSEIGRRPRTRSAIVFEGGRTHTRNTPGVASELGRRHNTRSAPGTITADCKGGRPCTRNTPGVASEIVRRPRIRNASDAIAVHLKETRPHKRNIEPDQELLSPMSMTSAGKFIFLL